MPEQPVGAALVGIGWWSAPTAKALKDNPKYRLVTCYTRTPEKRKAFAETHGCGESESYADVLKHPEVEAVILTTPNSVHGEQILQALEAGKHVFVEKPITNTLPEAKEVVAAHKGSGLTLMTGHCYRRNGGHRAARRLIDEGRLGKLIMAECNFSVGIGASLTPDKWRYFDAECPGGPLTQIGIHHADTLAYLLGPIRRVAGVFARLDTPAEVDDVHMSLVEFESGALGYMGCSYATPLIYTFNVFGSKANLYMSADRTDPAATGEIDRNTQIFLQERGDPKRIPVEVTPGDMTYEQMDEFADCVRSGKTPETGVEEGVRAAAFVHAAIRSAKEGRPVEIAEMLGDIPL
ncbi:MAG: Gfo/Idh/MocA family protein [Nitrospinota bacterium]